MAVINDERENLDFLCQNQKVTFVGQTTTVQQFAVRHIS